MNLDKSVRLLSNEDYEKLKVLNSSPFWQFYKTLLVSHKDSLRYTAPEFDTNKMYHRLGLEYGINFVLNHLSLLIHQHELHQDGLKSMAEKKLSSKGKLPKDDFRL